MNAHRSVVFKLAIGTIVMFGFAFALVPLYDVFCDITGLNGKTDATPYAWSEAAQQGSEESHQVRLQFVAVNNAQLAWSFGPVQAEMAVDTGASYLTHYRAVNNTDREMTVQAVPSVSPSRAAAYLRKIECFCFNRQTLQAGESKDMPIRFVLDSEIPDDVKVMTLSYTLFDVSRLLGDG